MSSSSAEEDVDLEEIEVALYSQIHYGTGDQALQRCPPTAQVDHIPTTTTLPYIITKTVQNKVIYVSSEAESPVKPIIEGRKEKVSVLENFLKLSKSDASGKISKKKRLSKMEAIQTIKPVRLRRDPQVVVNTDTDTDTHSESEDEKSCSRRLSHDKSPVSEVVEITSDSEDDVIEVNPNLDFNLQGGVEALLTAPKGVSNDWRILDEDRYNTNSAVSRYFSNTSVQCRNCKKLGHFLRDCPEPLKRRCVFCALEGHTWQACPNAVCYNCEAPGHKGHDCPEPKTSWQVSCDRCWMAGHQAKSCPDRWRQYHLTTDIHNMQTSSDKNTKVYCYNCSAKGHLGYECKLQRMNHYVSPSYPLIARYDLKRRNRNSKFSGKTIVI
ncbi:zinc finger CCHC domain-containing protein 7-like [Physella acuta]|uniref:zinc finger CCHC domain-containing protein 7-like n=1 Tax=Physella acuta TaxID=109671 RepID=UPI0027DBE3F8|nr:zinc finger CCHC domain-containing protein 7-like [Physella acuta]